MNLFCIIYDNLEIIHLLVTLTYPKYMCQKLRVFFRTTFINTFADLFLLSDELLLCISNRQLCIAWLTKMYFHARLFQLPCINFYVPFANFFFIEIVKRNIKKSSRLVSIYLYGSKRVQKCHKITLLLFFTPF